MPEDFASFSCDINKSDLVTDGAFAYILSNLKEKAPNILYFHKFFCGTFLCLKSKSYPIGGRFSYKNFLQKFSSLRALEVPDLNFDFPSSPW